MSLVRDKVSIMIVCVYCSTLYDDDVVVCPECNDYSGLIPVKAAKEEGR